MSTYASPLSSGKTSPQGALRILGKLFTSSGVISDSLAVTAQDTPDMSVKVSGSATDDLAVFIHSDGHFIQGWNIDDEDVDIDPNNTGVTKIDAIVAYMDLNGGDGTNANNPDAMVFEVVRGSGELAPTDSEIDTAVSGNPYLVLAYISVANGASSVNSGNITDERVQAQIDLDNVEAITPDKRTGGFAFGQMNLSSTGNLTVSGLDFRPKMIRFTCSGSTTSSGAVWGYGTAAEGYQKAHSVAASGSNDSRYYSNDRCIAIYSSTASMLMSAELVSINDDGFTINVINSAGYPVEYEAIG